MRQGGTGVQRAILARAKRCAERHAREKSDPTTDQCLAIGVQCGVAATLDVLGIQLRRLPLGDGLTSVARRTEPLPDHDHGPLPDDDSSIGSLPDDFLT